MKDFKKTLILALLDDFPASQLDALHRSGFFIGTPIQTAFDDTRSQGKFHTDTIKNHTLKVVSSVRPDLVLRLAALFHDVAKPHTRTVGSDGNVHFYGHAEEGAVIAQIVLQDAEFGDCAIDDVVVLIHNHMRVNCFKPTDSDRAVRRLRKSLDGLHDLSIELAMADNENHSGLFRRNDNLADLARRFREVE